MNLNTEAQTGFGILMALLQGNHKYSGALKFKSPIYVKGLPFAKYENDYIAFVGSYGYTASIGAFMNYVSIGLAEMTPCIPDVVHSLHKIHMETETPGQHFVFYKIRYGDGTEMAVGGCTDFSGEGGAGNQEMTQFFTFLSQLYKVEITQRYYNNDVLQKTIEILDRIESTAGDDDDE